VDEAGELVGVSAGGGGDPVAFASFLDLGGARGAAAFLGGGGDLEVAPDLGVDLGEDDVGDRASAGGGVAEDGGDVGLEVAAFGGLHQSPLA
jgi:hypothetical protein